MADTRPDIETTPFEQALLNVIGPADILEDDTPVRKTPPYEDICPRCGRPHSEHPVTRDPELGSVSECPGNTPV